MQWIRLPKTLMMVPALTFIKFHSDGKRQRNARALDDYDRSDSDEQIQHKMKLLANLGVNSIE